MVQVLNGNKYAISWAITGCLLLLAACNNNHTPASGGNNILLSGTVEAREIDLSFRVGGHIDQLLTDEGYSVKQGDVVARLDTRDFQLALDQANAAAAVAKAALTTLKAGTREQEVHVAEADLEKARAELTFARSEVKRVKTLIPKQLATEQQLDSQQLREKVAEASVKQARQHLLLMQEGTRKEDIEHAEKQYDASMEAVAQAKQQLSYTDLVSPVTGMITLRLKEAGEMTAAGEPVLRIAELAKPWVRGYLTETDLGRVHLGQSVKVRVDGLQGREFNGHLSFISPVAEFTPKTVETRQLRVDLVYRVKVDVDNPDGILKIGMPADIIIEPNG